MLSVIVVIEWCYRNSANIFFYFTFLLRIEWGARNDPALIRRELALNKCGASHPVLPEKLATPAEAFPDRGDADTHASPCWKGSSTYRRGGFATSIKLSSTDFTDF